MALVERAQLQRAEPDAIDAVLDRLGPEKFAVEHLADEDPGPAPVDFTSLAHLAAQKTRRILDLKQFCVG